MAESELIEVLAQVLDAMPEGQRKMMLAWAATEMHTRPILNQVSSLLWDDGDDTTPGHYQTVVWQVGQPSPSIDHAIVFAIIGDDGPEQRGPQSKVVVYSFAEVEIEGKVGKLYYKEVVFDPKHASGPCSGEGLYRDWFDFFATDEQREEAEGDGDTDERAHANGAA